MGERLDVRDDGSNPVDARALLVAQRGGATLNWIPSLLLDWVHTLRDHGPVDVRVSGLNGPDVPPGYRLLVILVGHVPPGYQPFGGLEWTTGGRLMRGDVHCISAHHDLPARRPACPAAVDLA